METQVGVPLHVPPQFFVQVSPAQHFLIFEHVYVALEQVGTGFFVGLMIGLDPIHLPPHVFEHLRPGQHFLAFEHIVLEQVEVGFLVGLMTGLDSAHE